MGLIQWQKGRAPSFLPSPGKGPGCFSPEIGPYKQSPLRQDKESMSMGTLSYLKITL